MILRLLKLNARISSLSAALFFISAVTFSQGIKIRDLPTAPSPSLSDYLPEANATGTPATYRVTPNALFSLRTISCTPPLLCDASASMTLGADRTLSLSGPNVRTINIACTGSDTSAIDTAWTALKTAHGGVLHLSGSCTHAGDLVNQIPATTLQHIYIEGDGPTTTTLTFTSCTTNCILLDGSANGIGSGYAQGSGIRNLSISAPTTKDAIVLKGLQGWQIDNIYTIGGANAFTITDSRLGHLSNFEFQNYTQSGIKIVGESFVSDFFDHGIMVSSGVNGVSYVKTTSSLIDGLYFDHVIVNGNLSGSAFLFDASATTEQPAYIFMSDCVADGTFNVAGMKFVNFDAIFLNDPWSVTHGASADGVIIDNADEVTIADGQFYSQFGSDLSLKNSVTNGVLADTKLIGPIQSVKVDTTSHDFVLRPSEHLGATYISDPTKILPLSIRFTSPPTFYTGTTKPTMLGMINPAGSLAQYFAVDSSGMLKHYADNGSTVLETLSQTGAVVFSSTVAGSNLSGTNTGDQIVPVNTTATSNQFFTAYNSGTGAFTKAQPSMSNLSDAATWEGWTDSGSSVTTSTPTDKIGIGTSSPNALLSVSANSSALPSVLSGTLVQTGQADGTANRHGMYAFAGTNSFDFVRADTTAASPSAIQSGDLIGQLTGIGYDGTAYPSTASVAIQYKAAATWTNSSHPTSISLVTTPVGSTTGITALQVDSAGHLVTAGSTPTVACTGTGTSPSAPTIDTGGTDGKFTITMNTGTGSPSNTGTCTVTFAAGFTTNKPVMVCTLVDGASTWSNEAVVRLSTQSLTAPVLTWTNEASGVLTGLATSSSYKISCLALQ